MEADFELLLKSFDLEGMALYNIMTQRLTTQGKIPVSEKDLTTIIKDILAKLNGVNVHSPIEQIKGCMEFQNETVCFYVSEKNNNIFVIFFSKKKNINLNALIVELDHLL